MLKLNEHEHDLRRGALPCNIRRQWYTHADTIIYDVHITQAGQARTSSGGLLNRRNIQYNQQTGLEEFETFDITELGTPYNVMNPFLTVKYIIYTGVGG